MDGKIVYVGKCCNKTQSSCCDGPEECSKHVVDFIKKSCGKQDCKLIYKVSNVFVIVVHGFTKDEDYSPCPLFIREDSHKPHKNGLGCWGNCKNEIDKHHFIQIDFGDYIRQKRLNSYPPKINISGIKQYDQILIYGSNDVGVLGKQIYCYTNESDACEDKCHEFSIPSFNTTNLTKTGDIYIYGPIPFRFISVTCSNGFIVLNSLTFCI
jgi:hypothetical protein